METCCKKTNSWDIEDICRNGKSVDEQVLLFQKHGNEYFEEIWVFFKKYFSHWYKMASGSISVSKEDMHSQYMILLWRCARKFNLEKAKEEASKNELGEHSLFVRYFFSACKKFYAQSVRGFYGRKQKSLRSIKNIPDEFDIEVSYNNCVIDFLHDFTGLEKSVALLRVSGFTWKEISGIMGKSFLKAKRSFRINSDKYISCTS
jgi:hypothetical protein